MKLLKTYKQFLNENLNNKEKSDLNHILRSYYRTGDISDFDIPEILVPKQKWLFNQLLDTIKELRDNNIFSDDFLNTSNWGVKKDGMFGIFDIGFGDGFEEFEKDYEPESIDISHTDGILLDKIKNKLNIGRSEYIGGGMFGFAHDIGDNKVLKITKDKTEAINSKKIKNKKLKHIADIYDVYKFSHRDKIYYVIILEKLIIDNSLHNVYWELYELFKQHMSNNFKKDIINKIKDKHEVIGGFLEYMCANGYKEAWDKFRDDLVRIDNYYDYDMNDISDIAKWIEGSVVNSNEIEDTPPDYLKELVNSLIS